MKELKYLYDIGFLQYYTYMNMRVLLQRDKDTFMAENKNTNIKQNPFVKAESMIIKQLRENDFATSILSWYQDVRFSQNLQRNIAGLLISQKVITEINNVTDIDKEFKNNVIKEYRERLKRRKIRLEYIAENYPEFYLGFEARLFEKISLIAAKIYIDEAHSSHELGTKVFSNINKRITDAID